MKGPKGKGTARNTRENLKPVDDRKIGKRKAVAKADKSSKRQPKKQRDAKKDPNKPKRPPSAFFVFLFVSLSLLLSPVVLLGFGRYEFEDLSDPCFVNSNSEEFRKDFKKEHPDIKAVSAVGKAGGEQWKSLSDAEKAPYEAKAAKKKSEYEKVMKAYNKKQDSVIDDGEEESDRSKSEVHDDDVVASAEEDEGEEEDEDDEED